MMIFHQYDDHLISFFFLDQSAAEIQHDSKFAEREDRQRLDQIVCYHFADE
jgi:hypothetical protein